MCWWWSWWEPSSTPPWLHALPQLLVTVTPPTQRPGRSCGRSERSRSRPCTPPAALIPLLDRFPASNAAPARFWFQDVLLQAHVLLLFPQAAGRRSGGPGPGRLRWSCSATGWGCGPADRNVGNSIPAGTSGLKKASILPGRTPEHRQHLQAPSSTFKHLPADPFQRCWRLPSGGTLFLSCSLHPPASSLGYLHLQVLLSEGCSLREQVSCALMFTPSTHHPGLQMWPRTRTWAEHSRQCSVLMSQVCVEASGEASGEAGRRL